MTTAEQAFIVEAFPVKAWGYLHDATGARDRRIKALRRTGYVVESRWWPNTAFDGTQMPDYYKHPGLVAWPVTVDKGVKMVTPEGEEEGQ